MGLLSHTWIGCLLAFLPGPPRIMFYKAHFQLYPIDKTNKYCPEIIPGRDIGFYFFSREFPEKPRELRIGDDVTVSSSLNAMLPTVIYFPAFFDGLDSENVRNVKEAYLKRGGHNFLVVNYERLNAGPWYSTAVTNTFIIGMYTAPFIDYLVSKGVSLQMLHFVGFSIGAHTAGVTARFMSSGRPARITGIDPAAPLYVKRHGDMILDKSDADFVDVIHTDRVFGMFYPIGHVDFFVNSEVYPQPGCRLKDVIGEGPLFKVFCSHLRANDLYATSVLYPNAFPGFKCDSWNGFQLVDCHSNAFEIMGNDLSRKARGVFYVATRSQPSEIDNNVT